MTPFYLLLLFFDARGVVLDPMARPIPGATVVCGSQTTSTNERGEFQISGSGCEATISKDGFTAQTVELADGQSASITMALAPASDRVVVSATGAPVSIEDAGVSATVITQADFNARENSFLEDYLRDVPGLSVVQTNGYGGLTSLFVRGGTSSSTLVLLDGMPLTDPGGAIDLSHLTTPGIDRVEVIRGPESALFGAEASSGVVQLFTHRGDAESDRPHGYVSYERGSYSTDHWTASLDGGLMKRIDYSFTADQFRTTGEYPNSAFRITSGTANVGYRISDKTSVHAVFREFDAYNGDPGQVYYGLIDDLANDALRDSAISVHLDDARSRRFVQHVMFGYHRNRDLFTDNSNYPTYNIAALLRTVPANPVPYVYLVSLVPPSTTYAPPGTQLVEESYTIYPGDSLTLTDRTDADYQGTLTHKNGELVFGYQFERQAGVISGANVDRYDNGFFATEQYSFTPRIFATGGLRVQESNVFGTEVAPRGSVTFRLPTETFFRVSASRGILEPSLLENFANESFYVGNRALKPEVTDSYEAGFYREWLHQRVRTDLALFRNSFHDLIQYDESVYPGTWQNIEQSWARGAEVSASVRVTRYLALRGGYTRLYTKITLSDAGDTGQELLRQPRNSGSVSVELTPGKFTLLAGARLVGERMDNDYVFGVNRATAYQYVFASGSWQATRHLEPFVRIENALDQVYQEVLGYASLSRTAMGGVKVSW